MFMDKVWREGGGCDVLVVSPSFMQCFNMHTSCIYTVCTYSCMYVCVHLRMYACGCVHMCGNEATLRQWSMYERLRLVSPPLMCMCTCVGMRL